MKLPIPKEEDGKRMMMTSTGRKGLICEGREASAVGGHDIQGIQFRANMDLGSGDTQDHFALGTGVLNNYDSFNWDTHFDSRDFPPAQFTSTKSSTKAPSGSTPTPSPPSSPSPSKPPTGEKTSYSPENIQENASRELMRLTSGKSEADNLLEEKLGRSAEATPWRNSTLVESLVEDGKEPNFTANESNPTVPAPAEPSKTSTLRLSDRTRSESEDDIEKMDEPEQEGTLIGHETLYKTQATIDKSPNSDKIDKNGNRSDSDQNETDNDCVVQCLYYTIQCCECVIF